MLAEAERQAQRARTRLHVDVMRSTGHVSAAWDAAEEAEHLGANAEELLELRLRLLRFAFSDWLPVILDHGKRLPRAGDQYDLSRGIALALRSGLGWIERTMAAGALSDDAALAATLPGVFATIDRLEATATAPPAPAAQ